MFGPEITPLMDTFYAVSETFRGWYEMQRRNITTMKTNDSKASSSFENVGNIISTS